MSKIITTKKQHNFKFAVVVGLATGLYPLIFYYTQNFSLINSWKHLGFFIGLFIITPIIVFLSIQFFKKIEWVYKKSTFLIPFLNITGFLCFLQLCVYARLNFLLTVLAVAFGLVFALFFKRFFKKVVAIQYILAVVSVFWALPVISNQWKYSKEWTALPDTIEQVTFKKRPNVYYIQPDGYVNFSELSNDLYDADTSDFEHFLSANGFTNYDDFRTNYTSTLYSNSSIFSMRHHFYKMNSTDYEEPVDARSIIVTDNPVLSIFKKNRYTTHLVTERPYFFANHPELGYDFTNIDQEDLSFISTGLDDKADIFGAMNDYLKVDPATEKFFFIQIFDPKHITSTVADSEGMAGERAIYKENLQKSNEKLTRLLSSILAHDDNPLIVIMADHGGYVGFEYTRQSHTMTTDRDLIYSIFSSILTIKWPDGEVPQIGNEIKSPVNLFRVLFSYLGEEPSLLEELEEDASYIHLREGDEKGIYQYIDSNGDIHIRKRY